MQKLSYTEQAKIIINTNIYCTIATASLEAIPWISPVFFAYDDSYNLYWVSSKLAKHSQFITQNSCVAIVIFNSSAPEGEAVGVYLEAKAEEILKEEQVQLAMQILNSRITNNSYKIKNSQSVTGDSLLRIYSATIQNASILSEGEVINGQYVDTRKVITLS